MVENVFEILVTHLTVQQGTIEKMPRVVRDIMFMYVVLHSLVRTGQLGHQPQQMM